MVSKGHRTHPLAERLEDAAAMGAGVAVGAVHDAGGAAELVEDKAMSQITMTFSELEANYVPRAELTALKAELAQARAAVDAAGIEHSHVLRSLSTSESRCRELERANGELRLDVSRVHGDIGLFAESQFGLSNNLPTDETFKLMGERLNAVRTIASRLKTNAAEWYPEIEDGKKHFARIVMESYAEELEAALTAPASGGEKYERIGAPFDEPLPNSGGEKGGTS